ASDARDTVRDRVNGYAGAGIERQLANGRDAIRDCVDEHGAIIERPGLNAYNGAGNRETDGLGRRTLNELGLVLDEQNPYNDEENGVARIHCYRTQTRTLPECILANARDVARNGDVRQAGAVIACRDPDAGDTIGNRNVRQAGAVKERKV